MDDYDEPMPEIYVLPGESHLVSQPTILRTVLGSCVGLTFLVPRLGIGALCHPMLPNYPAGKFPQINVAAGRRYVDFAIRDMARQLDALGALRSEVQIKLFGGGDVLVVARDKSSRPTVGRLNSEMALRVLEEEGFNIKVSKLGGNSGVHIQFETRTGEVILRRLNSGKLIGKPQPPDKAHHSKHR
jgi:chemotaxis protein CheD